MERRRMIATVADAFAGNPGTYRRSPRIYSVILLPEKRIMSCLKDSTKALRSPSPGLNSEQKRRGPGLRGDAEP